MPSFQTMPVFVIHLLSFLAATASVLIGVQTCLSKQEMVVEAQVERAMKKLWSPDESERLNGKEELFRLGHNAVPTLISVLEEIFANPTRHHFPTGKEAEGRAALELFNREPFGSKPGLTLDELGRFEITWRLKSDAYELLGRLRAVEAVPLLIRIMENRDFDNLIEKVRPEMAALITIGVSGSTGAYAGLFHCRGKGLANSIRRSPTTREAKAIYRG